MTSVKAALANLISQMRPPESELPEAEMVAAPSTIEDLAQLLAQANVAGLRTLIWGGGSHQGLGGRVSPDLLLVTTGLERLTAWEPEDLTVVVEGGVTAGRLEDQLAEQGQTALLPTRSHQSTVGGVIAAGISSYQRGRYGPTRDRILEVTLVTGDGRVVKGGARVVKNVTGYDLPRLAAGSLGSIGVVSSVCLKLWPLPASAATVVIDDPERVAALVYRPLAIISTRHNTRVYLAGTDAEVNSQIARLGGDGQLGHEWPADPPGQMQWSLRIPPALVGHALETLPAMWGYVAQHGVGVVELGSNDLEGAVELREWAEARGGALVLAAAPDEVYDLIDPWGTPPPTLDLQRRVIAAFDPGRILNPGRMPGGV